MLDVLLGGLAGVMFRVAMVAVSQMGMMRGLFMMAGFVVRRGMLMMPCGVLVVLGGFAMMIRSCVGHGNVLLMTI